MANSHAVAGDDDDVEVDVEAERRLQGFVLGMKQQADQLLLASRFPDALRLYRELLMHLTRSQVKMISQKDLVISCRMNILAVLSKTEQWAEVPPECERVLGFLEEIQPEMLRHVGRDKLHEMDAQILGRVFYFRGFALFRLGAFAQANQDFQQSMQLLPNADTIREDWKALQGAMQLENQVKQLLSAAMNHFQGKKFDLAVLSCTEALKVAEKLDKGELIGLIHGNLAAALIQAGRHKDAIASYKAAIDHAKKMQPTPYDRLYDLMDGETTCHMTHNDLQSAYGVLKETVKIFSKCTGRQDREHGHFMNVGRVCFAMEKFDEAEKHFIRAEGAAAKAKDQDGELNAMTWLGKTYAAQSEMDKARDLAVRAIPIAKSADKDEHLSRFRLLWLNSVDPHAKAGSLKDVDVTLLWEMYEYFGSKRLLGGRLHAALLLVTALKNSDAVSDLDRRNGVFSDMDDIRIPGLTGGDAKLYSALVLERVDCLLQQENASEATKLLRRTLETLAVDSTTTELRESLLRRLGNTFCLEPVSEDAEAYDDDMMDLLRQMIHVLRQSMTTDADRRHLSDILARTSQAEARRRNGNVADAQSMLEESITIQRRLDGDAKSDHLYEALVGLCVLHMKRGQLPAALEVMEEIEAIPNTKNWTQLQVVKEQLNRLTSPSTPPPTTESPATINSAPTTAAATAVEAPRSALELWWDEWWFAISVVLVGIIFAVAMAQES